MRFDLPREDWMTQATNRAMWDDELAQEVFPYCSQCKHAGASSPFVGFCYNSKRMFAGNAPKFKKVGWFKKVKNDCEHFEKGE